MKFKKLKEELELIAGAWNGDDSGRGEENSGYATEALEHLEQLEEILKILNI